MQTRIDKQVDQLKVIPGYEPDGSRTAWIAQPQYERFGPWNFNEITGYIRLYLLGSQVRGDYFSAEKKRVCLGRTRVFVLRTSKLAVEVNILRTPQLTNREIWLSIQKYVNRCRKEFKRGRVVDDSVLNAVGPHVDWLSAFGWDRAT